MKAALRFGAFGAACLTGGALADTTSCLVHGKMSADPALMVMPNGGYVNEESQCQFNCAMSPTCTHFTWKAVGNSMQGILDNGCWLLSGDYTFQDVDTFQTPGRVVSGPKHCPTQAPLQAAGAAATVPPAPTVAPNATVAPAGTVAPTATAAPTATVAPPAPTVIKGLLTLAMANASDSWNSTGVTDAIREGIASALAGVEKEMVSIISMHVSISRRLAELQQGEGRRLSGSAVVDYEISPAPAGLTADSIQSSSGAIQTGINTALASSSLSQYSVTQVTVATPTITTKGATTTSGGKSGFPWWAIVVIIAGAAVLVGLIMVCCSCGGKSRKASKKKKSKRSAKADEVPLPLEVEAPAEAVPLVQAAALAEPMMAAQPAPAFAGGATQMMPMAAPVATMNSYQPMNYMQQPVYNFQPAGFAARQPQFAGR